MIHWRKKIKKVEGVMRLMKDGIALNPKEPHTEDMPASDELVKQKSEEIEKKYAEAFLLLAKGQEKE